MPSSSQSAVAGNDSVGAVDQDRIRPAKLDDARGGPCNPRIGVRARISRIRNERRNLVLLNENIQLILGLKGLPPSAAA